MLTDSFPVDKTILFCVLNWGLGHATRSIPIIDALLARGNKIILASDGEPLTLLKRRFPELNTFELPSYGMRYPFKSIFTNMLLKSWALFRTIRKEHKLVNRIAKKIKADLIISDNRMGCYATNLPGILITHQLQPFHGTFLISQLFRWASYHYFKNFQTIWVPDTPVAELSGNLSRPFFRNPLVKYIGIESRLAVESGAQKDRFTLLLSGPEPQRSLLEEKLLQLCDQCGDMPITLVRGTKLAKHKIEAKTGMEVIDLANDAQLSSLLSRSFLVVCRSGYSTLMDLYQLQTPAFLIPTPGQTEQEYLADLHKDRWPGCPQDKLTPEIFCKVVTEARGR
ncbi:MAG: glycosyltransferase [Saprospiraceae bacterium]|nr:glycosyltransferase [Saprospiraceae bacterium]